MRRAYGTPPRLGRAAVEILESLYQHRLLSTRQIHDLHTPSSGLRFTQQTLARLRGAGLADKVRLPGGLGVWFLPPHGIGTVEAIPDRVEERRKIIPPEQAAGPLQAHTLAVNDVGVAFVQMARRRGDEFGPFAWRHEIAHPLGPPGRRRQKRLIADAILTYQLLGERSSGFHYRFLELDRANRPADNLAAKLGRYGWLYRLPAASGGSNVAHWKQRYPVFPNLLVVLAGRPRAALERRRRTVLALCRKDGDLAKSPQIEVTICLLDDLLDHGPSASIFRGPADPDQPVDWLGVGDGERGDRR